MDPRRLGAHFLPAVPSYWVRISTLEAIPALAGGSSYADQPDTSVQSRGTENLAAALIWADHPIVGDEKYFRIENYELPGGMQNKLHLLARRIVVPHPRGGTACSCGGRVPSRSDLFPVRHVRLSDPRTGKDRSGDRGCDSK